MIGPLRLGCLILIFALPGLAQNIPQPGVPLDPTSAILDAFKTHPIVALGEGTHGNDQSHAFRLALIRDPRFTTTVNDIVVEFGNARYQDVMDRFTTGGDVPLETLREAWENTTQPNPVWDKPIYEEFFRAVRAVNAALPSERQVRVLLGDPPIDWTTVLSRSDLDKWADRDGYAAAVVRREVLAKGRRALLIYGDMHFLRKWPFPVRNEGFRTLVTLLETGNAITAFSIWTHTSGGDLTTLQRDISSWDTPALTVLRGTIVGAADFGFFQPSGITVDDKPVRPMPGLRMQDEFDAVLYLGRTSTITISRLPASLCARVGYMEMRVKRMALMGMQGSVDQLKQYCTSASQK
jgi:hypothetical protein